VRPSHLTRGPNCADQLTTVHSAGDPVVTNITWKVQIYDLDPEFSNTYFFWLFNGTDTADKTVNGESVGEFASPYFSIIPEPSPRPTTTVVTTSIASTALSTSAASTTAAATAAATTSATTTSAADNNTGSGGASNAVAIGLGAGLGVSALLLMLGAVLWFVKRRRKTASLGQGVAEMPATAAMYQPSPAVSGKPWDHGYDNQPHYEKRVELAQSNHGHMPNELE
jgi:hypothetical protein